MVKPITLRIKKNYKWGHTNCINNKDNDSNADNNDNTKNLQS